MTVPTASKESRSMMPPVRSRVVLVAAAVVTVGALGSALAVAITSDGQDAIPVTGTSMPNPQVGTGTAVTQNPQTSGPADHAAPPAIPPPPAAPEPDAAPEIWSPEVDVPVRRGNRPVDPAPPPPSDPAPAAPFGIVLPPVVLPPVVLPPGIEVPGLPAQPPQGGAAEGGVPGIVLFPG